MVQELMAEPGLAPRGFAPVGPFRLFRVRTLFVWHVATLIVLALIGLKAAHWVESELTGLSWLYGTILLWMVWLWLARGVSLRRLAGAQPPVPQLALQSLHVVPLILASFAGMFLFYVPLSYVLPDFVEWSLQSKPRFRGPDGAPHPVLHNAFIVFFGVVAAPVAEEMAYRGVFLHRWTVKWGLRRAVWTSSILFALGHTDLLGSLLFGYVMCRLYLETRSLLVPIVVHMVNNATAYGVAALWEPSGDAFSLADFRRDAWVGAVALFFALPWLLWFLRRRRSPADAKLPYFDRPSPVTSSV